MSPQTVADSVSTQIRELVLSGELAPGDRIPAERELARHLQVGRGAVREALRELRAQGLLVAGRGRAGTVVGSLPHPRLEETFAELHASGAEHVADLMDLRTGIEAQTALLAARRADPESLGRLADLVPPEGSVITLEDDMAFHLGVARAARSPLLLKAAEELLDLLHGRLPVMFRTLLMQPADSLTVRDQHQAVLEAIRQGSEQHSREAMVHHLQYVARTLAQLLGTQPSVRMVVADLDGTVLAGPRRITDRTRRAVAAVRDSGIPFVLASSRPPRSIRAYHTELGLATPVIAGNGALLWDLQANIPLARISLDADVAAEITDLARTLGAVVNIESDDDWFADRLTESARAAITRYGIAPPTGLGRIDQIVAQGEPVDKMFIDLRELPPDEQSAARAAVTRAFYDRVRIYETVPAILEFNSQESSKAVMAQRLARNLGVTAEQVFAVGDHDNDVPLLRWAGLGVAMGNGSPAAKAAAAAVTSSNLRDGLAEALERWVLAPSAHGREARLGDSHIAPADHQ